METVTGVSGKKILLVDDDPSVRESLKLMLCFDHHTVTEAADGNEALRLFSGDRYDLVITDYVLPGMRGDELTRRIKQLVPGQPVCIVTAYIEEFASGPGPADVVLGKPFGLEELRHVVGASGLQLTTAGSGSVEACTTARGSGSISSNCSPNVSTETERLVKKYRAFRRWGIND